MVATLWHPDTAWRAVLGRVEPASDESLMELEDCFAPWLTDCCWKFIPSLGIRSHTEGGNNAGWKKAINQDASRSREIVCTCSPVLHAVGRHLCLQWSPLSGIPKPRGVFPWGTGVGGQDPLSIAPELPSPVPSGHRPCARMAFGRPIKRRNDVRMSHDTTSPNRHRPILHLRQTNGSTRADRKSTRLNSS